MKAAQALFLVMDSLSRDSAPDSFPLWTSVMWHLVVGALELAQQYGCDCGATALTMASTWPKGNHFTDGNMGSKYIC